MSAQQVEPKLVGWYRSRNGAVFSRDSAGQWYMHSKDGMPPAPVTWLFIADGYGRVTSMKGRTVATQAAFLLIVLAAVSPLIASAVWIVSQAL